MKRLKRPIRQRGAQKQEIFVQLHEESDKPERSSALNLSEEGIINLCCPVINQPFRRGGSSKGSGLLVTSQQGCDTASRTKRCRVTETGCQERINNHTGRTGHHSAQGDADITNRTTA